MWEWGTCTQWTRQDWLDFVVIAISVENEPQVRAAMQRRAEAMSKTAGRGGANSSTFAVGGKK